MSVTTVFVRLNDDTRRHWINNQETFDEKDHPNCEAIELGVESMAARDLAARAKKKNADDLHKDYLYRVLGGLKGMSIHDDGDFPRVISKEDVATVSEMMDGIDSNDLRRVYDIKRLKADYLEIEDWMWDDLGPNVLDEHLIPIFEETKAFFRRASESKQQIIVYWY